MKCIICERFIHPERLALRPGAKTCSHACAEERKKQLRRKNSADRRLRLSKEKAAAA